MSDVFKTLNAVNVQEHVEQKGNLSYLSWAWAWQELKKRYPDAQSTVYENENGWNYFTDGKTAWVKTGVTVEGLEHIEYLPIMDNRNRSIPLENIVSTDVNKAIQRSITKAIARHGLGLYIYAGEDLPEEEQRKSNEAVIAAKRKIVEKSFADNGASIEDLDAWCKKAFGCEWEKITDDQTLDRIIKKLNKGGNAG